MEKTSREYAENLAWETYPDNSLNIERVVFVSSYLKAVEETNVKELREALEAAKNAFVNGKWTDEVYAIVDSALNKTKS